MLLFLPSSCSSFSACYIPLSQFVFTAFKDNSLGDVICPSKSLSKVFIGILERRWNSLKLLSLLFLFWERNGRNYVCKLCVLAYEVCLYVHIIANSRIYGTKTVLLTASYCTSGCNLSFCQKFANVIRCFWYVAMILYY